MLRLLEGGHLIAGRVSGRAPVAPAEQLGLFVGAPDPLIERLRAADPDRMTPLDALTLLGELARGARDRS